MCEPRYFTVRDVKNPFMQGSIVDQARAQLQWDALRQAIEAAGVATFTIEPVPDLEDMVFSANQSFAGRTSAGERFAVMSRMRYPSREREVPYYRSWLREHGFKEIQIDLTGEYLEGHGDLLWHPGEPLVWAGHGFRSSRTGVDRFRTAMAAQGIQVRPLELVDPRFYHLDTCFSPLNNEAALIYPGAFSAEAMADLRKFWDRLYEVHVDDALRLVCNGIVAQGRLITSYMPARIVPVLATEKLLPAVVDLSEFEKAGGGAFCMKTFVG